MKKIILAVAAIFVMATATQAQDSFSKGSLVGTIGVGFGATYGVPISGALDWSVVNLWDDKSNLGLGVIVGLGLGSDHTWCLVGGRASLHYQFVDKLDTYLGLTLGYLVTGESGFGWDAYLGARYYFWDNIGLFAELGAGWSNVTLGVSFKF
ncbi:MAG: hypothetical protein LBR28_01405 [Bacteroidales bacterium]|jgi:hypothetical protein|nr:hypothetical protein [Bacteroidales bacterium]